MDIDLYLECYAPARLTRVIAQASLGSPCVSVRLRVLGGWVGRLPEQHRVCNFFGSTKFAVQDLENVSFEIVLDQFSETAFALLMSRDLQ